MSEDLILRWLRRRADSEFLGDDAAFLPAGGPWAVTVDSQRVGVHLVADPDPTVFARRLLAVNLSDLAAVGAVPQYAFLALGVPRGFDHRRFFQAFLEASLRYGVTLAGGDLATSDVPSATLTLLGRKPKRCRWLRRGDARPGDAIWVGGCLGEAALGCRLVGRGARLRGQRTSLPAELELPETLVRPAQQAVRRHQLPVPQLKLGQWLGRQPRVAAIDISDGLSQDLHRLCQESGCGGVIEREALPLAEKFELLTAELQEPTWDLVLHGGEDYVLLFTLPADVAPPPRFTCHRIGRIARAKRLRLVAEGTSQQLQAKGWDHFREDPVR